MGVGLCVGCSLNMPKGQIAATYIERVLATNPIAYWPLTETSGTTAVCQVNALQNGTYQRDVSLMGTAAGPVAGQTAPVFDAANDWIDIYTATLAAAFSGAAGTLMAWFKVSGAGVWTDGTLRYAVDALVDANNRLYIIKSNINNSMIGLYEANNIIETAAVATTSTAWQCMVMTWSKAAEQVIYYLDGSDFETDINLGVWAGALSASFTAIGAQRGDIGNSLWSGQLAHVALWSTALAPATILELAT